MTTYIINGNSISPEVTLEGILNSDRSEKFIVLTNDKCPVKYLSIIDKLCEQISSVKHRSVKTSQKKWFSREVKRIYGDFLNLPEDQIVILPVSVITGSGIERFIYSGRVSIATSYKEYKENTVTTTPAFDWNNVPENRTVTGGRIHFLIDYENVGNFGLEGAEYLTKDDYVTVFYSKERYKIQQGYFDVLSNNTGFFDLVRLVQNRKNGLDFYIATCVGEIVQKYPGEKILIISKDQGFHAIVEYCGAYKGMCGDIKFAPSIEIGIVMLDGATDRRNSIIERRRTTNIEDQYTKYVTKKTFYDKLSRLLSNTPYINELERVFELAVTMDTPKKLYTSVVRTFGTKRGREIYRLLKQNL